MGADESIGVGRVSNNQHLHKSIVKEKVKRYSARMAVKKYIKDNPNQHDISIAQNHGLACMFFKNSVFCISVFLFEIFYQGFAGHNGELVLGLCFHFYKT